MNLSRINVSGAFSRSHFITRASFSKHSMQLHDTVQEVASREEEDR